MMNVDEVLAKMDAPDSSKEEIQYIIDENLRVISIPPLGVVLGVEGDKDVNSAKFKMVRYYKGIDLSKFDIRINFANANGDLSYYTVKNPTVTDDTLTFEWLVGYLATKYKGTVRFVVRMIITDASTGEVHQAFDTTVGEAQSLEGLLVDTPTDEKVYDLVAQLKADLTDHLNNLVEGIPADYSELTKKVDDNTSEISELKEDLTDVAGTVGIEIAYSGKFVEIEPSEPILADTQWSTQGNAVFSKTSSTMTAGKFPVVSGNKIKLYGIYNGTVVYPLGIFVDENNGIILVVGNTDNEATIYGYKQQYTLARKEALEVTVPEGAKYVLVNGRNKTSGTLIVCPSKAEMYVNNSEQTKIKDIEFSPLYKKKIGFAGDSVCYGNGYVGGYARIIGENNEVTVQNLGIGSTYLEMEVAGSTVITSVNGQRTTWTTLKNGTFDPSLVDFSLTDDYGRIRYAKREWTSKHQYEYTEVTQSEWNGTDSLYIFRNSIPERVQYFDTDCDYIIMEGGINDVLGGLYLGEVTEGFTSELNTHTVLGGTEQMCRNLLARFADKKLGFILIHKVLQLPFTPPPNADGTQKLYFDKIKEVLNKYSIPVLDLYNKSGLNTGMDSFLKYTLATSANPNGDGVHPTEEGYRKFYVPKIEAWLKSL